MQIDIYAMSSFVNSATVAVMLSGLFGFNPLAQSTSFLFSVAVNVYGVILQLLEPLLIINETVYIAQSIFRLGGFVRDRIHEEEDHEEDGMISGRVCQSASLKLAVLLTLVCGLALSVYQLAYSDTILFGTLSVVCLVCNVLIHLYCFYHHRKSSVLF